MQKAKQCESGPIQKFRFTESRCRDGGEFRREPQKYVCFTRDRESIDLRRIALCYSAVFRWYRIEPEMRKASETVCVERAHCSSELFATPW